VKLLKGAITKIEGDPFTGIALIALKNDKNGIDIVFSMYFLLISNLILAYNEIVTHDLKLNFQAIEGKEIYYTKDESNRLSGFMPVEKADLHLITSYGYFKGEEIPIEQFGQNTG